MNILVLGMHRSGTSAMTGILNASGYFCGSQDDLAGPNPMNPGGYYERPEFVALNDALLRSVGWTWDAPAPEPPTAAAARPGLVDEGRALVERLLARHRPWVLKDPRISLLLPWWRRILLDRFVPIVMVRPPAEIAWSLWVRDGLPPALGHALWAAYHRHLASGLEGLPAIVVDYPSVVEQPESVIASVLEGLARFGVDAPRQRKPPSSIVDPFLRRATQPAQTDLSSIDDGIGPLADAWSAAPVTIFERFSMDRHPPAPWEVAILEVQRRLREEQASTAARLRSARADAESVVAQIATSAARADAAEGRAATLADEGAYLRQEVARLEAILQVLPTDRPRLRDAIRGAFSKRARRTALTAWLRAGLMNPLFDADWYRQTYPDVPRSRMRAWLHWRRHGWREERDPEPLFDTSWYLDTYPDVRASGMDPLAHYLLHGAREGRDPGPGFDSGAYMARYPDVRVAAVVPLHHYRRHGVFEGRVVTPREDGGMVGA